MRIGVVGSGYVGLVAGACFADLGHDVILVDNDQQKLASLKAGVVPIHEYFLPELLQRHSGRRLHFSDDLHEAVRSSAAIFIAVGTPPTDSGDADLSYVESVAREISGAVNDYRLQSRISAGGYGGDRFPLTRSNRGWSGQRALRSSASSDLQAAD